MGNICEWLFPKKKNKEGPYNVHEDTFQANEQIGVLDSKNKNSISITQNAIFSVQALQSMSGYEQDIDRDQQRIDEKKFLEEKNKFKQQQQIKEMTQKAVVQPTKQQVKPVEQKKKMPILNILPVKKAKKQFNPDDYRFINEDGQFKVKKIDSLKKQQFNIDNCKNSQYFIFDITANLYIDDSENCFIFLAPCESTIFVRNCKNMVIVAATGQFRTYQCHNSHFSIYCKSQPVIESSSQLHFSSLVCPEYELLPKQFQQINLYPWNNNWSQIHNFTPKQEKHHTLSLTPEYKNEIDWQKAFQQAELILINQKQTVVPLIQGALPLQDDQFTKAVLIFSSQLSANDTKIKEWISKNNLIILRAHKKSFADHGKDKIVVIQIACYDTQQLDLTDVPNTIYMTDKAQVEKASAKYFISFGDER